MEWSYIYTYKQGMIRQDLADASKTYLKKLWTSSLKCSQMIVESAEVNISFICFVSIENFFNPNWQPAAQ
jgi:hypothetical protein